jgi:hypothetical protein
VGARGIANLINEGIVYPEKLLNILESFYEVVLKDYPEEKDLALYGVKHVALQFWDTLGPEPPLAAGTLR